MRLLDQLMRRIVQVQLLYGLCLIWITFECA